MDRCEASWGSSCTRTPLSGPEGLSILVSPLEPSIDIVFVHGFTGHPERTWLYKRGEIFRRDTHDPESPTNQQSSKRPRIDKIIPFSGRQTADHGCQISLSRTRPEKTEKDANGSKNNNNRKGVYWPQDLLPAIIPGGRILTFGYDTNIRHVFGGDVSKSSVYDIAWDFLVSLDAARDSEPTRPLLFVVHSLGGIVVKELLRRSRSCAANTVHARFGHVFKSTAGLMFFGTPHGGADPRGLLAHIVEKIAVGIGFKVNRQIVDTLLPSSERLKELRDEFGIMTHERHWMIYSFQEQYGVKGLNGKVVEDNSSCLNDANIEIKQHIARNHMDMCRFSGSEDPEFLKVTAALRRMAGAALSAAAPTPEAISDVTAGSTIFTTSLSQDQCKCILDSLRFDQMDARYMTIKTAHAATCKWLLVKSEYLDWLNLQKLNDHHGFLWIKGKPGTGKSTLMKFILAHAKRKMKDTIIISFFFNARGDQLEKTTMGMFRSLVLQLLEKVPDFQSILKSLPLSMLSNPAADRWTAEILKELLSEIIKKISRRPLACFVDALDECDVDEVRDMVKFFQHLGELAVSIGTPFHVCFSSRHYPHITIDNGIGLILEGQEGHNQDITNYLYGELKIGHGKQAEEIRKEMLEKASGVFMWVVLVADILNKEFDRGRIHSLRKRLKEIPADLHELFKQILLRDTHNREDLLLCLQWVLYARRPLTRQELYFAIISGVDDEISRPWDQEELGIDAMERFILDCSKGLAELTKSKAQTVQFIHESVRDFLLKENGIARVWPDLGSNFEGRSHDQLKRCCYSYINLNLSEYVPRGKKFPMANSKEAAALRNTLVEKFPFLEYAVHNVLYHADIAEGANIQQQDFVDGFRLRDWITLGNLIEKHEVRRHTSEANILYILAEQGCAKLLSSHPNRHDHFSVVSENERYGFPLLAALANNDVEAVRALLQDNEQGPADGSRNEAAYNMHVRYSRDLGWRSGRDIMSIAAEYGDVSLVTILLAKFRQEPDISDKRGRTPLLYAAAHSHTEVAKLLLHNGANPNSKNVLGEAPLHLATSCADPAIFHSLLQHGAEIDAKDKADETPLHKAAKHGKIEAVKFLLTAGANVNAADRMDYTPLHEAARKGHSKIVEILIQGGAKLESKITGGYTPLNLASCLRREDVVKLLLAYGADADARDNKGRTILSEVSEGGKSDVVKMLLLTGKVNPDARDITGRTPLSRAGTDTVATALIETGEVDPDSEDIDGCTPLYYAVQRENEWIIEVLLSTGGVDPCWKNKHGESPMSLAEKKGECCKHIVERLRSYRWDPSIRQQKEES